jgi:Domain of unknown function (DUF5753)/Helix-turn-helix domain
MASMREQRIAAELRRLRGNRTGDEVQAATGITPSKLSRIEAGLVRAKPADIEELGGFYGTAKSTVDRLLNQAKAAREPQWWTQYVGPNWDAALAHHLELETEASRIESWMIDLVPGLLQTSDYVRALIEARPDVDPSQTDRRVQLREARRARVERGELAVWVVLAEAALHQEIGGKHVLADQLRYLTTLKRVTVQVLPFSAGAHAGLGTSFHLMHFPEWPTTVYQDTITRGLYQDEPNIVAAHSDTMAHIQATALSPRESKDRLLWQADQLEGRAQ